MASLIDPAARRADAPFADTADLVRAVLRDVLALKPQVAAGLRPHSPLFGALPELDSMAVAGVLTELEDRLGILIDDDEVTAGLFETFGSLVAFADQKRRA